STWTRNPRHAVYPVCQSSVRPKLDTSSSARSRVQPYCSRSLPERYSEFPSATSNTSSVRSPHLALALPFTWVHLPAMMSLFISDTSFFLWGSAVRRPRGHHRRTSVDRESARRHGDLHPREHSPFPGQQKIGFPRLFVLSEPPRGDSL